MSAAHIVYICHREQPAAHVSAPCPATRRAAAPAANSTHACRVLACTLGFASPALSAGNVTDNPPARAPTPAHLQRARALAQLIEESSARRPGRAFAGHAANWLRARCQGAFCFSPQNGQPRSQRGYTPRGQRRARDHARRHTLLTASAILSSLLVSTWILGK